MQFDYMICPANNLGINIWTDISCRPNPVFVWRDFTLPTPARIALSTVVRMFSRVKII